jgi:hypothetical protein
MVTGRGVPAMSALPPLPLLSFNPDWEARWEAAHRRHLEIEDFVSSATFGYFDSGRQERLNDELRTTGAALGRLFEAQFQTTDDYRDWRLRFFDPEMHRSSDRLLCMPTGLPIREIRRRITAAFDYGRAQTWRRRHAPSFCDRLVKFAGRGLPEAGAVFPIWERAHVRRLLSGPPTAGVIELASALRQAGGDRV